LTPLRDQLVICGQYNWLTLNHLSQKTYTINTGNVTVQPDGKLINFWDAECIVVVVSGTLTVEEVYKDRDQFAALVREVAAPDVGRMGIEILSFTIKDVYDEVQYLASLGKSQTAAVKRDADIGVAQANRDAGIRVSLNKKFWEQLI
jgi:hypothetical protein